MNKTLMKKVSSTTSVLESVMLDQSDSTGGNDRSSTYNRPNLATVVITRNDCEMRGQARLVPSRFARQGEYLLVRDVDANAQRAREVSPRTSETYVLD